MLLPKNYNDAFEFVRIMHKILLVTFSGHGVYRIQWLVKYIKHLKGCEAQSAHTAYYRHFLDRKFSPAK